MSILIGWRTLIDIPVIDIKEQALHSVFEEVAIIIQCFKRRFDTMRKEFELCGPWAYHGNSINTNFFIDLTSHVT